MKRSLPKAVHVGFFGCGNAVRAATSAGRRYHLLKRRVVVTGVGMITPVGLDTESSWEGMISGKSGIKPIT